MWKTSFWSQKQSKQTNCIYLFSYIVLKWKHYIIWCHSVHGKNVYTIFKNTSISTVNYRKLDFMPGCWLCVNMSKPMLDFSRWSNMQITMHRKSKYQVSWFCICFFLRKTILLSNPFLSATAYNSCSTFLGVGFQTFVRKC